LIGYNLDVRRVSQRVSKTGVPIYGSRGPGGALDFDNIAFVSLADDGKK
jgi:hypothetical protein